MMIRTIALLAVAAVSVAAPVAAAAAGVYGASAIGYDVSYATHAYPATNFGFGIVGVTRGKAFVHNPRFASEYAWARFGSVTAPTVYMNLNAPYGSTVAGHIGTPKLCLGRAATSTEPTACEGYNYGYNAAKDAFSYAKSASAESAVWWLDIEEANSWSEDATVNGATIQGAIDFLNAQGVRVGIYSMPYMWRAIAGRDFVPAQALRGQAVATPIWLPVGIKSLVGAINTCVTGTSFIAGSPIWLIQYVADAKAIDQNLAC